MIKDMLVYLDQSPTAVARLQTALMLAKRLGANVTAIHIIAEPFLRATSGGMAGHHMPA